METIKKYGFNIIELSIIILLIFMLYCIALPKIINLSKKSQIELILNTSKNLINSIKLSHKQWVSAGEPAKIQINNNYIWMGEGIVAPGWPQNVTGINADTALLNLDPIECINLWNTLLQNPPKVDFRPGCNLDHSCTFYVTSNGESCTFTDSENNFIIYDRSTGKVLNNLYSENLIE